MVIDLTGLTFNPKEVDGFEKFIFEQVTQTPDLKKVHKIWSGIKYKEQIIFASLMGKTGLKATGGCDRVSSGAKSVLTSQYWEPAGIEDTLIHCTSEMNSLFKAYYSKIKNYREHYEIKGLDSGFINVNQKGLSTDQITDITTFILILFTESMIQTIWRAVWFSDENVAAADSGNAGLIDGGNDVFYNYIDGLWNQIFTKVSASEIAHVTITENAIVSNKEAQLTLGTDAGLKTLQGLKKKASQSLKGNKGAMFLLSGELFESYTDSLTSRGAVYNIDYLQNGLGTVKFGSYDVVNMDGVWDLDSRGDFVNNTTDNVYNLPHRAVFTVADNIPIGTTNEDDFATLEVFYDRVGRKHREAYGFDIDSKIISNSNIVVAY